MKNKKYVPFLVCSSLLAMVGCASTGPKTDPKLLEAYHLIKFNTVISPAQKLQEYQAFHTKFCKDMTESICRSVYYEMAGAALETNQYDLTLNYLNQAVSYDKSYRLPYVSDVCPNRYKVFMQGTYVPLEYAYLKSYSGLKQVDKQKSYLHQSFACQLNTLTNIGFLYQSAEMKYVQDGPKVRLEQISQDRKMMQEYLSLSKQILPNAEYKAVEKGVNGLVLPLLAAEERIIKSYSLPLNAVKHMELLAKVKVLYSNAVVKAKEMQLTSIQLKVLENNHEDIQRSLERVIEKNM